MQSRMAVQEVLSSYREAKQLRIRAATGKHCTNYGAEVKALEQGAKTVYDLTDQTTDVHVHIVFLNDSRSARDALHIQSEPLLSRKLNNTLEQIIDTARQLHHTARNKIIIKQSFKARKTTDNYQK